MTSRAAIRQVLVFRDRDLGHPISAQRLVTVVARDPGMICVVKVKADPRGRIHYAIRPAHLVASRARADISVADDLVGRVTGHARRMRIATGRHRHTVALGRVTGRAGRQSNVRRVVELRPKAADRWERLKLRRVGPRMAGRADRVIFVFELRRMAARTRRMRREPRTERLVPLLMTQKTWNVSVPFIVMAEPREIDVFHLVRRYHVFRQRLERTLGFLLLGD